MAMRDFGALRVPPSQRRKILERKPGSPYSGNESSGDGSGSSFLSLSDQVLLSKSFHSRPGPRQIGSRQDLPRYRAFRKTHALREETLFGSI